MKIIFNSSMPRSGSELLQVILHQNPSIYGSATSPLLEYQYAARANMRLPEVKSQNAKLMSEAFLSMCDGMAREYYRPITERPVVCDKNRGWFSFYEWVEQWNENPKMICMVRDLRSIVGSMERIYLKSRHLPAGPDDLSKMSCVTLEQRVRHWMSNPPVGLALSRLLDLFQRGKSGKILFVRYEDLCSKPQSVMDSVYKFIEEPVFTHDLNNIVKQVHEDDSHYGPYGNHSVRKSLSPARDSDWSDVIPKDMASAIRRENSWYFDSFNY